MAQLKFAPWHFVGQGILMDEDEETELVLADLYDEPAAKLIEAAPALYEALRQYIRRDMAEGETVTELHTLAVKALCKAEGRDAS